jgi:Caspase domain
MACGADAGGAKMTNTLVKREATSPRLGRTAQAILCLLCLSSIEIQSASAGFVSWFSSAAKAADGRRVALVIGNQAYPGTAQTLRPLNNPRRDAARLATLLDRYGFDVIRCDGVRLGCFDQNRDDLTKALALFESRATDASLALVFFAGHGLASAEGNIITPIDARVSCDADGITNGIAVEQVIAAAERAHSKIVILDACRNNPIDGLCPVLREKRMSFTRIEAGQRLLLVNSTQFGQQALDGPPNAHSPFAHALLAALESNPTVYFEQVMNEVARATQTMAQRQNGFLQVPRKVVDGAPSRDCLQGENCSGDPRMAALAVEVEKLTADANRDAQAEARWEKIDQASRIALATFAEQYANTFHGRLAQNLVEDMDKQMRERTERETQAKLYDARRQQQRRDTVEQCVKNQLRSWSQHPTPDDAVWRLSQRLDTAVRRQALEYSGHEMEKVWRPVSFIAPSESRNELVFEYGQQHGWIRLRPIIDRSVVFVGAWGTDNGVGCIEMRFGAENGNAIWRDLNWRPPTSGSTRSGVATLKGEAELRVVR